MLIVRAPMRLSLAGGGTDVPEYYEKYGGMVVSTAIDKYVYVVISPNGHDSLQISSSDYSLFFRHAGDGDVAEEGELRYARAFLREFRVRSGYSVFTASELPPGTGLGSSSSLAVALTKGLAAAVQGQLPSKSEVAETAARVEIVHLRMPIGKQDHYAAAFGGLNAIRFTGGQITVEPLRISAETRSWINRSILIFFTDQSHHSADILAEQLRNIEQDLETVKALDEIKEHAELVRSALLNNRPEALGEILHQTWVAKKRLAQGISNPAIDSAYDAALAAGATGGKIAGAGGGGFLLLVCPPDTQRDVVQALERRGLHRADFHADSAGARILVNNASG